MKSDTSYFKYIVISLIVIFVIFLVSAFLCFTDRAGDLSRKIGKDRKKTEISNVKTFRKKFKIRKNQDLFSQFYALLDRTPLKNVKHLLVNCIESEFIENDSEVPFVIFAIHRDHRDHRDSGDRRGWIICTIQFTTSGLSNSLKDSKEGDKSYFFKFVQHESR